MKSHHSLQKLVAVAVCAVMMLALPSLSEARSKHHKGAGKHSSKSIKTAKKSHKHKSKKTASHKHKSGKKSKVAKNHSDRLPKGVIPPSRVRIIDTAGKNNPETFPMPEMTDVGAVAATTKPADVPEEIIAPAPEPQADAFTDLETQ